MIENEILVIITITEYKVQIWIFSALIVLFKKNKENKLSNAKK